MPAEDTGVKSRRFRRQHEMSGKFAHVVRGEIGKRGIECLCGARIFRDHENRGDSVHKGGFAAIFQQRLHCGELFARYGVNFPRLQIARRRRESRESADLFDLFFRDGLIAKASTALAGEI